MTTILLLASIGCRGAKDTGPEKVSNPSMELVQRLASVENRSIQFAHFRPPGSRFATLGRRVKVVAPPEAVKLAEAGDPRVLDELVKLLPVRERAWAAEVMLAAMTGEEADLVVSYGGDPDRWIDTVGATAAARWTAWLGARRDRLRWDAAARMFVVAEPPPAK